MPDVIPMLAYEDGVKALEWLAKAFGFIERTRWLGTNRELSHGEMQTGDGLIMLASPTPDYENPRHHREVCERANLWLQVPWVIDGVLVYVDDVDVHYEQAKRAGATVLSEPETGSVGRLYRAEDLEGHRWMFMQREGAS